MLLGLGERAQGRSDVSGPCPPAEQRRQPAVHADTRISDRTQTGGVSEGQGRCGLWQTRAVLPVSWFWVLSSPRRTLPRTRRGLACGTGAHTARPPFLGVSFEAQTLSTVPLTATRPQGRAGRDLAEDPATSLRMCRVQVPTVRFSSQDHGALREGSLNNSWWKRTS